MTTSVARLRAWALITVLFLSAGTILSACGAGSSANSTAIKSACESVGAALSDGPDPGADPVGYAEAQILPLKHIKVDVPTLQKAINELDAAYKDFFDANGAQGTSGPVNKALMRVETFCPGVAQ
jgi:hypothetical protein